METKQYMMSINKANKLLTKLREENKIRASQKKGVPRGRMRFSNNSDEDKSGENKVVMTYTFNMNDDPAKVVKKIADYEKEYYEKANESDVLLLDFYNLKKAIFAINMKEGLSDLLNNIEYFKQVQSNLYVEYYLAKNSNVVESQNVTEDTIKDLQTVVQKKENLNECSITVAFNNAKNIKQQLMLVAKTIDGLEDTKAVLNNASICVTFSSTTADFLGLE